MRNVTVDIWKFIASLVIVALHIGSDVIGIYNDYPFRGGDLYVEFFFMVSGYYLIYGLERGKIIDGIEYVKKRALHIFPYTTIVVIVNYIYLLIIVREDSIATVAFLKRFLLDVTLLSHFEWGYTTIGFLWFIADMLFVIPIICLLHKHKDVFKVLVYTVPILWWGYSIYTCGHLQGSETVFLLRTFAGMMLGGTAYYASQDLNRFKPSSMTRIILTFFSWFIFGVTVFLTYKYSYSINDLYCVCYFFISLVLIESDLTNDIKWGWLNIAGKLSMTIYLTHILAIQIVEKLGEAVIAFKQSYILYYLMTFLLAVILMFIGGKLEVYIGKKIKKLTSIENERKNTK